MMWLILPFPLNFHTIGWLFSKCQHDLTCLLSFTTRVFIIIIFYGSLFCHQPVLGSSTFQGTDNHITDTSAFSYNVNDLADNNTSIVYAKQNASPLHCPPILNIPHAVTPVPNGRYFPGTKVVYSCENGYKQVGGSDYITCSTRNGSNASSQPQETFWTNTSMKCQVVDCGDPGFVENAIRNGSVFTFNSMVTYTCNKDYETIGVPFLLCKASGHWNRERPKCELRTCPILPEPANGIIIYSNGFRLNSSASLRCNSGFRLKSPSSLTCSHGRMWIGNLSECEEIFCPLYKPHSGVTIRGRKKPKYEIGSALIAICHDRTSQTISCRPDGTWSIGEFHCPEPLPKLCPIITPLENGRHNGSFKLAGYPDGTLITFKCNANYYRDGAPYIRCLHGNWTSSKPRCALHEYYSLSRSPTSSSNPLTVLGTVLFAVLFFILLILSIILHRLRQRHLEKQYWKRYFGNHTYRQSRTNITATCNQEMRFFCQSRSPVPVTDL